MISASSTVAIVVVAIATATDLRNRRVPNALTFGAAAAALAFHSWAGGAAGIGWSAAGWGVGVALFLPFFLLRGLGAGDVKLLGAVGAWLGPVDAARTALFAILAGGALALIVGAKTKYLRQALSNLWALVGFWRVTGVRPMPGLTTADAAGPRLPYAAAIALGTIAAIFID